MITRKIRTKLIKKDELFKVLALGEVTQLPILLIGEPGVAKTQTLIDYAAAMYNYDKDAARANCFAIELDEGTKSTEIKGRPDMQELLKTGAYKLVTPITEAEYLLINEVDKGSSSIRNSMLSVMRERALFLGNEIRPCKWKLFAGSCNVIPQDELENPFWDRFVIKYKVDRITATDIHGKMWKNNKPVEIEINLPDKTEIENENIHDNMMKIFIGIVYKNISDRTAYLLPKMIKAIKFIWAFDDAQAIMKCCELVAPQCLQDLSSKLEDPAVVAIKSQIKNIPTITDHQTLAQSINKIENDIKTLGLNPAYVNDSKALDKILKEQLIKAPNVQDMVTQLKNKAAEMQKFHAQTIANNADQPDDAF